MDDMKKMFGKPSDGKMSASEAKAKMDVLHELLAMVEDSMGSNVKNGMSDMQKVSVMAPDQEGLSHGLDVAKDLTSDEQEDPMSAMADMKVEGSPEEESLESPKAEDEEEQSFFGKKAMKPEVKKKKLFSMMDDDNEA